MRPSRHVVATTPKRKCWRAGPTFTWFLFAATHARLQAVGQRSGGDALLARAGLLRLGLDETGAVLDPDEIPAVGQGAVSVTCREDDGEMRRLLAAIGDAAAVAEVGAERAMLAISTARTGR